MKDNQSAKNFRELPSELSRKKRRINSLFTMVGAPRPVNAMAVAGWLKQNGIVYF
jgi:hypothetical protein